MIDFVTVATSDKRAAADALVIPVVRRKDKAVVAIKQPPFKKELDAFLKVGDFSAKEGEVAWIYPKDSLEPRIILLGLGDGTEINVEQLRRIFASLGKACIGKKLKKLNLFIPDQQVLPEKDLLKGLAEGLLLVNYSFRGMKTSKEEKSSLIQKVSLIGASTKGLAVVKGCVQVAQGVYFARDLVNGNADDITPQHFVSVAHQLAKQHPKIKTTIFDKKRLVKERFDLILAVNRGSDRDPALIVLDYRGAPKSKERIVLVGKGITYDTGGLNLKPTGSMETMRCDMAGAAAVLGTLIAVVSMELKQNITIVIPTTENSIDAASYKPGDVYSSYSGKSVEIGNTDAEGRLVLADALAYAVKELKPTCLIDLATLTGAMDVALGSEYIGLFSNDDKLSQQLTDASNSSFERAWRLPLVNEYREQLKSDLADLRSTGGKGGGSIKAALFLEEFVGETPWAHLDIASVAYGTENRRYLPKHGTGVGVRLLVDFLAAL